MYSHTNPQQMVLRLDSATGFAKVGWAAEMPIGRFIPLAIIAESCNCTPITADNPLSTLFSEACRRARQINLPLIAEQKRNLRTKGFLPVPLDLNHQTADTGPDEFGCYHAAAMAALFRLTANNAAVWAVINQKNITQLCSCKPPKPMEELQYQVWKSYNLQKLARFPGQIMGGKLMVQESGLWFCPQPNEEI